MAIETLILAQDRTGWRKKGYIIYEKDSPAVWGSQEGLPNFIRVTIPDATIEQTIGYREQWHCVYDWEVVNSNPAFDGYRVRIFGDKVNLSNVGAITREKLDTHLTNMGFVFVSAAPNSITYDFSIYTTAITQWFWSRDITDVDFEELNYNQETGVHTISADYSIPDWPADKVAKIVEQKGGVVAINTGGVITFTINRSNVISALKNHFRQHIDAKIEERRFYVSGSYVDSIVSGGGLDTKTRTEFLALINDRLEE